MSRLMSVAMTADAVIERRKTVTRRKGWLFLKPGDTLTLCRKVQGRRRCCPGCEFDEPLERLAEVEVINVRREPLCAVGGPYVYDRNTGARIWPEVVAEGFPDMHPHEFMRRFFFDAQHIGAMDDVTRIEWRYLDGEGGADVRLRADRVPPPRPHRRPLCRGRRARRVGTNPAVRSDAGAAGRPDRARGGRDGGGLALVVGCGVSGHEGSHGRYSSGCRCNPCREAHRIYTAERRKAALEAGELSHGLRNTYDAGCRCDKCYGARQVAYYTRERKPGQPFGKSRRSVA